MSSILDLVVNLRNLNQADGQVEFVAFLGNASGVVEADPYNNVYVIRHDASVLIVRNTTVPKIARTPVIVGYSKDNPKLLQVLRALDAYDNPLSPVLPDHADQMHGRWGLDPIFIDGDQFLPGLVIPSTGVSVDLVGAAYWVGDWIPLDNQNVDFASFVPTSGAAFVLAEVDNLGVISKTIGDSIAGRELLAYSDIPHPTLGKLPLFAVKVYAGQTSVLKTATSSDIIDLRWANYGVVSWSDIYGVPVSFPPDTSITDPLYVRKFDKTSAPTVDDDVSLGYLKNDLWHDTAGRKFYLCHDNADGAADWFDLSSGAGEGSSAHDHAQARWGALAGDDTFELPDVAQSVDEVSINGLAEDGLLYSLSADKTQIIFDTGLPYDSIITANYLVETL